MIDLHSHILPQMDDGAQSMDEAIAMAELYVQNGVTHVAATPHLEHLEEPEAFYRRRDHRLEQLRAALAARGLPLQVLPGAEVLLSGELFYAGNLKPAALAGSPYLLVEFGFGPLRPTQLLACLEELRQRGFVPVVAHPERYAVLQRDPWLARDWCDAGALLQVNAPSLAGFGAPAEARLACTLAELGLAHVLAGDAHSARRRAPLWHSFLRRFPPELGSLRIKEMTELVPAQILGI
jgi:protein-tyrosine phosphatase